MTSQSGKQLQYTYFPTSRQSGNQTMKLGQPERKKHFSGKMIRKM